jgi:hypothetical protein
MSVEVGAFKTSAAGRPASRGRALCHKEARLAARVAEVLAVATAAKQVALAAAARVRAKVAAVV